jgi:O-antigen/teichoic acid export membrane protein
MNRHFDNNAPRKRFIPNLISNGIIFVLNVLIGLWFTPYLIRYLGVAAYGLVPLATSLTSYFSLINLSLNGAAGRFLTLDLETGDFNSANRTFNTVLVGNLGLVILTFPVVLILVWSTPRLFDIPTGQESHAQWLFAATLFAYLITVIQSSFSVSSWAQNRFDLRNSVIAIYHIVRVGIVVVLFSQAKPVLWHVGLGIFAATIIAFAGDVWLWRKLTPKLRIQLSGFDNSRVRQLFGMGGWLVVNQVGTLFFLKIDLIVANTVLGAEIAGGYSSVLLFSIMLRQLAQTASAVLTPTILAKYARGELNTVNRISQQTVKFIGLSMALPIGLICGLAQPLLELWLGPEFVPLAGLLVVSTAHLAINLAVLPLFSINMALNKVKLPGIVTLVMGIGNVILAVLFVRLGWGALGIATAGAIMLTLKNALFTPIYAASIQKLPWWTFIRTLFPIIIAAVSRWRVSLYRRKKYSLESLVNGARSEWMYQHDLYCNSNICSTSQGRSDIASIPTSKSSK